MKRIMLLIGTNLAIMLVLGIVSTLTGAHRFFTGSGLDLGKLLFFALLMGFGGSFISLWMSKTIAKWSTGARVIETPGNSTEFWLVDTVRRFADKAGLSMPEVAIYEGEPNAFATGASRNSSLVAVSTGLLQTMTREEAEAVIAHEVAHIANGDMVTLTLIQGVVNTFVIFIARVVGWLVDSALRRGSDEQLGAGNRLHHYRRGLRHRLRHSGQHHRHVFLAAARIPRRRRRRAVDRLAATDDGGAAPPRRHGSRRTAAERRHRRHQRTPRLDGTVLQPSAD
jgi:hypothetical protein